MTAHPERSVSGVRRWLTYLTLFLAAGTIIGDLITLVFYLLEGELSLRFILKVLVVLLLAGSVFSYYLLTLRNEPDHPKARAAHRNFFALSVVVVVAALVLGAWTVGSPGSERERKFDERRIEDLRTISNELHNIVYGGGARPIPGEQVDLQNPVPSTAQEVADSAFYTQLNLLDPETGVPYEYEKMSSTRVQLCAVFNAERSERYDIFWNHPAGHYCFDVDVTETRY